MTQDWKQQINELLFQILNEKTTLREFEDIALEIYARVLKHNDEKVNNQ